MRDLGFACRTEAGSDLVPADVFCSSFADESAVDVDVSVVHPLPNLLPATVTAGSAAEARESEKVQFYASKCASECWSFRAFVGETTGAWGDAAQRFVRKLFRYGGLRLGKDPASICRQTWFRLSLAIGGSIGPLSRACLTIPLQHPLPVIAPSAERGGGLMGCF